MKDSNENCEVAVNLSGGKDSIAMLLMMLEREERVDHIIFADTGVEFPEVYSVLEQVERMTGKNITRISAGKNFEELLREGRGWPNMCTRWCTGELKKGAIRAWTKQQDVPIQHCIGIASDERYRAIKKRFKRYPLCTYGVTEAQALQYCYDKGITWDGLYESRSRIGCFCCPLQRISELKSLRRRYPDLWKRMLEMDKTQAAQRWTFRVGKTLHDYEAIFSQEEGGAL